MRKKLISVVIPAYNEEENIFIFHRSLASSLSNNYEYEFLFVNDGSRDKTAEKVQELHKKDPRVLLVCLSRNFGKEIATTAGIHQAKGEAIICLDADGQHPPELIQKFIEKWEGGSQVVVGVRQANKNEGFIKHYGSKFFYILFNKLTKGNLIPGSTDYRLIDKVVQSEFKELRESNRITRGLIDWLGFKRDYIYFTANERMHGEASYSTRKLIGLAVNTFVSMSFTPLYLFGYIGAFITILSFISGMFVIIEEFILGDPMQLNITGSASLGILVIFLVGLILISQALASLYISRIYEETKQRPLFIVDPSQSILE